MERLTLQQVFNNAWNAFVVRGEGPGMREDQTCVYRAENGCKCALGHSIPDELYVRFGEAGIYAYEDVFKYEDRTAIHTLQQAHDNAAFSGFFQGEIKSNLERFASVYNLTIPEVN